MKKIIFKKLLSDCLIFFLVTLLGISSIIWVFQAVNFLDIIIEDGRNYSVYMNYTLLNIPKIITKVLPFCIFFSFSYVFIKYEMNNELMIFWNHGIEKLSVINFFLLFSLILLAGQIFLTSIVVPKSEEISRSELRTSDVDYFEGLIKPKKFNDTIKGLTIYADDKNKNNELINIYIKKAAENSFQITYAKKGVFENKGNNKILVLYDGQTLSSTQGKITNFSFSKSDFGLGDMNSHMVVHKKLQEQPTESLINCIKSLFNSEKIEIINCNKDNPRNVYRELIERLINPFYLPLLILISSINLLIPKENINYLKIRFLIFIIGILIIIISESLLGYVDKTLSKNLLLIFIPMISVLLIYSVLFYKFKFNKYKYLK